MQQNQNWQHAHKKVKTIFYQGLYNSQTQASKYILPGFTATTGEYVQCSKGLNLIHDLYIGQEINEITPMRSWYECLNPVRLYNFVCSRLANWYYGITVCHKKNDNNTDENTHDSLICHSIDYLAINFGQEDDIYNHYKKYIKFANDFPDHDYILWGVSKGGATTINAVATNKYDTNRLKMIVLEGCYDSIENVFASWQSLFGALMLYFLPYLPFRYKSDPQWDPINRVSELPDIPILIITSKADTLVPAYLTHRLADKLVESGHHYVHVLELESSAHPMYMFHYDKDRKAYYEFIHRLYKQYSLPYLPI